ncbi:MAG: TetR/AcrR family transcriptional regulator [Alphaproteobacteria bacterium]|nr:TetR/AcrR family transcriptional regulator [Alphaproteobacteria bacterium]MBU0794259.1 TetR/AcrR family transcriptional regulator [Alphaproteobacteria bacterium]MBU0875730.1 TetR/AcrR family transcriptional regulator [Alphaproteobacteria bacterium]MBU1769729.1 TetR/AcrR family transcriptional regulator [Alphaproteobacteria bacterium]
MDKEAAMDGDHGQEAGGPRVRADARRNEDALLEAAKAIFAASGVDAPAREIAARAGVGVGTLYRRFPSRADLVIAVFKREVDACTAEAVVLASGHPPGEALALWLRRFTRFIAAKRGLAQALHSGDPAFQALPDYFRQNFEPALAGLLDAAVDVGAVRSGIEPYELLRAIGNLAAIKGAEPEGETSVMVELLIDGLRLSAGKVPPAAG